MVLTFENLIIRNAIPDDAEQLALWWNNGLIMAHAGFPMGLGQSVNSVMEKLKNESDESFRHLIIEVSQNAVGEMSYRDRGQGIVEISIKICDFSLHNKGIGKKVLSMLISFLFKDMKYEKIVLDTNLENRRAQHVYEQLGFRKSQILENSWKNQLGEPQSTVKYELCPDNFVDFTK